ncbi:MAG: NUDIX domain-containing protein [Dehalococcoidia bacterium]|nr:NUDIX domain-containing protein [Dehalococcoidia bacterium]
MAASRSTWQWRTERHVSAGGVVYRCIEDGLEIALCGRTRPKLWALPKGTPIAGETLEDTAHREVEEETGLKVVLEEPVEVVSYWFIRAADGVRCDKTVHFYLMRAVGGSLEQHDPEFELVQWFPATEAVRLLTHVNEAKVAEKALALAEAKARDGTESPPR